MKQRRNRKGNKLIILNNVGGEYVIFAVYKIEGYTATRYHSYTSHDLAEKVFNLPWDIIFSYSDCWAYEAQKLK